MDLAANMRRAYLGDGVSELLSELAAVIGHDEAWRYASIANGSLDYPGQVGRLSSSFEDLQRDELAAESFEQSRNLDVPPQDLDGRLRMFFALPSLCGDFTTAVVDSEEATASPFVMPDDGRVSPVILRNRRLESQIWVIRKLSIG